MTLSRMTPAALLLLAVVGVARAAHPDGAAAIVVPAHPIQGDCGTCTKTICVREPEKVAHVKTVYRCKTKTICLPFCGGKLCGKKPCGGCDAGCDAGECGKPRQVRVLVKRFVKEDRCESKCKPREVPAPACAVPVKACPAPSAGAPTDSRPTCLPSPCALPAMTGVPATGTVIHGTTAHPLHRGK